LLFVFDLSHPHLYPPPPKGRGRIKEGEGIPFILKDIVKQCGETVQL